MEGLLLVPVSAWRARRGLVVVHIVVMKMAVHIDFIAMSGIVEYVWELLKRFPT